MEKYLVPRLETGKYKKSLEYLAVSKASYARRITRTCPKDTETILKELPKTKKSGNLSIKINSDCNKTQY